MPNTLLGVRRAPVHTYDEHGAVKPATPGPVGDLLPAMMKEQEDGSWLLCLDPDLWPVRVGDAITDGGTNWRVSSVKLLENPLDSTADYIRCVAAQQAAAGVEPGGREFVGR